MSTDLHDPPTTQAATPPPIPKSQLPKRRFSKTFWWLILASVVILVAAYFVDATVMGLVMTVVLWFVSIPLALDWQRKVLKWLKKVLAGQKKILEGQDELKKMIADLRSKEQSMAEGTEQNRSPQEIQAEVFAALDKEYGWPEGTFAKKLPALAQKINADSTASPLARAYAAYAEGNFDKAEKLFLEDAPEQKREQKQRVANIIERYENAGWSAEKALRYEDAIRHFKEAAQYTDPKQCPIRWAEIQSALAYALYHAGYYRDAEDISRKVVEQRKECLGAKHSATLNSCDILAVTLNAQGKHTDAEAEFRAVLKLRKEALGARHPDTLTSRSNLANVLNDQGKCTEAETEHRAVLKLREEILGGKHPDTLASRNNLAAALFSQGKYAEAEAEFRTVLNARVEILTAKHPDTLRSHNNLAGALYAQGKHAEAEAAYRAVLKLQKEVLEAKHHDTLTSYYNLAIVLCAQNKDDEAEAECRTVLELLGNDHPYTIKIRELLNHIEVKKNDNADGMNRANFIRFSPFVMKLKSMIAEYCAGGRIMTINTHDLTALRFSPFAMELKSVVAGYYTGDRTAIMATDTHDLVVQHHELIHERICTSTLDGLSLWALLMLKRVRENGVATPGHVAASADELIQKSRFAQEVGATYLGVKSMPPDSHDSILERLPPEYSSYFNEMKNVLDRHVKTSYLQYLVGWNIVTLAFWSPLLTRLVAAEFQTPVTLAEEETPDFRLRSLLGTCARLPVSEWDALMSRLQTTADMFCAEHGCRTWNLQDEEAWVEAGKAVDTTRVELALSVDLRNTFAQLADFPVHPEVDESLYIQLQALLQNFRINLTVHKQIGPSDVHDQLWKADAWNVCNVEIVNSFARQVPPRNDLVLQSDSLRDSPLAAMTLVGCPDFEKRGRTWIFEALFAGKDDTEKRTIIGSTSEEHVVHWLRHRRTHIEEGRPVAPLTLLVAIHNASGYARTTREIIDATFVRKPDGSLFLPDGDLVLWYVDGNLVDWLEEIIRVTRQMEMAVMAISHVVRTDTTSNFKSLDGTVIKMYKLTGIPGHTCRILTRMAQKHLDLYEQSQGVLTFDSSDDTKEFASSVVDRLLPLLYRWWPSI
ncbi:MAG: tetratricopeptide repeat protein [Phycisphaerales bacterium]|nr:tetratricopeptide repeat protein [Phycisphaerales bacterium]